MCGIAGLFDLQGQPSFDRELQGRLGQGVRIEVLETGEIGREASGKFRCAVSRVAVR